MNFVFTLFAELVVAFAGLAIGMCALITVIYWRVFRKSRNSARLLPAHIMAIGTSYAMLAFIAVSQLGDPPPPTSEVFWVYPFSTAAFLLGDIALLLILLFISRRGARYGRRATDPEV